MQGQKWQTAEARKLHKQEKKIWSHKFQRYGYVY